MIAKKFLGPDFYDRVREIVKNLKGSKGVPVEDRVQREYYYSTVDELIKKNRQLVTKTEKFRQTQSQRGNEMFRNDID